MSAPSRFIRLALCAALLMPVVPHGVHAQSPPAAGGAPVEQVNASLDQARALIKTGDYDGAIELLRGTLDQARPRPDVLREAYLLLIKTHVILGNDYRFRSQGRENSRLNYERAKEIIAECLRTPGLRGTRPEPVSEYPEEMIGFFAEVRGQLFGSFRVAQLDPADAVVRLDADTLRRVRPENAMGEGDLAIGTHRVVVSAPGHKDLIEEITISPNSTLERSYRLTKKRSPSWYATVGAGAAGLVAGVVALMGGKDDPATDPILPDPPPPPSGP